MKKQVVMVVVCSSLAGVGCKEKAAQVEDKIEEKVEELYGVKLDLACEGKEEPIVCKGAFEGVEVVLEYADGRFETRSGVIAAEGLQAKLVKIGNQQGADLTGIDCGPAKIYAAAPGKQIACKLGPRTLTIEVKDDGTGINIVSDVGGPPATP